jgi:catechol 2,3-dioxygenase-like lactoylglutathione lyase family enzyme
VSVTGSGQGGGDAALLLRLDHVVVAARTLAEGVDWCEATLGIAPGAGGRHDFMGTHNRVFGVGSPRFPQAYFEIIAVDREASRPSRARWFDLDDSALQRAIANQPRLIHWVARTTDIQAGVRRLRAQGFDPGEVLPAERQTPSGWLRWQIAVRADGRRLCDGALPTLIEWGALHPSTALAASGVVLEACTLGRLPDAVTETLDPALHLDRTPGAAPITLDLATQRGRVRLSSLSTAGA